MPEEEKAINPDVKQEVVGGLAMGFLFMVGLVLEIVGFIMVFGNKLLGDLLWLVGTALIVFTIIKNFKSKHGKGFRIANIVMKIIVVLVLTVMIIIANTYPG